MLLINTLAFPDYDDDPNLMYAFKINLSNGLYWNGAVKEEQIDTW